MKRRSFFSSVLSFVLMPPVRPMQRDEAPTPDINSLTMEDWEKVCHPIHTIQVQQLNPTQSAELLERYARGRMITSHVRK